MNVQVDSYRGSLADEERGVILLMEADFPRRMHPLDDSVPKAESAPRLRLAERWQGRMITESLEQRLDANHPVRNVWAFVEQLDRSPLHERI